VKADMGRLVHVAVGGSSGWGKSVFLRSLAFQLAQSVDKVDLALIDLEGATFAPFAECSRLLWPVADTEQDALASFGALTDEMDRRKALYAAFPGVDSLRTYNARAGDPLPPVVALVDEATALLSDKSVENAIRTLVLRARKYGLWCVLGGQDWKASSLDTAIRNQLASRVQFRALSASQSRVLLQRNGAENLDVPGRALAILPGRDIIELQAPVIGYRDILTAMKNGGPRHAMPETQEEREQAEQAALIRRLAEQGASINEIQRQVFGTVGGSNYYRVKAVLDGNNDTETSVLGAVSP
jgi:S-DNA-T family DNA segregation ATPase FtsK/SpoIIIE